ncbi:HlyD family secretion protein [Dongia sedimenti]|uniref:HlyD family secretion protein n=1 Tax=Dongia sedimenti TaxID=3064282 RepID=A0ABU0YPA0_9PROT|nr:HlyD family secretion protein [Rhodospirillaceae bacterium R-7]
MKRTLRRILLGSAAAVVVAGAAGFGGYWYKTGRFLESTDDAYVQADFTTIAPKVSGYIADVKVEDNQTVKAGQVLAVIDDRDFRTALAQAQADVASAKAEVANIAAQLEQQQSVIQQAEAAILSDQAGVKFAQQDYQRFRTLTATRATSVQDEQRAQSVLDQQNANLQRDRAALSGAKQQVDVLNTAKAKAETQVQRLQAVQAQAELNLSYTTITAPIDGSVGARSLRVGQYVQAGTQLMAVVPLHAVYVVANFKETQLSDVKAGQPVEIAIDGLPGVTVKGKVDSLAPASGLEFALLPPDNATGNFTKIVQRIPVKIALDLDGDLLGRLRPGMSAEPVIDTRPGDDGTKIASK